VTGDFVLKGSCARTKPGNLQRKRGMPSPIGNQQRPEEQIKRKKINGGGVKRGSKEDAR